MFMGFFCRVCLWVFRGFHVNSWDSLSHFGGGKQGAGQFDGQFVGILWNLNAESNIVCVFLFTAYMFF